MINDNEFIDEQTKVLENIMATDGHNIFNKCLHSSITQGELYDYLISSGIMVCMNFIEFIYKDLIRQEDVEGASYLLSHIDKIFNGCLAQLKETLN